MDEPTEQSADTWVNPTPPTQVIIPVVDAPVKWKPSAKKNKHITTWQTSNATPVAVGAALSRSLTSPPDVNHGATSAVTPTRPITPSFTSPSESDVQIMTAPKRASGERSQIRTRDIVNQWTDEEGEDVAPTDLPSSGVNREKVETSSQVTPSKRYKLAKRH